MSASEAGLIADDAEDDSEAAYQTGGQGRPSSRQWIEQEFDRRAENKEVLPTLADEAKVLRDWIKKRLNS